MKHKHILFGVTILILVSLNQKNYSENIQKRTLEPREKKVLNSEINIVNLSSESVNLGLLREYGSLIGQYCRAIQALTVALEPMEFTIVDNIEQVGKLSYQKNVDRNVFICGTLDYVKSPFLGVLDFTNNGKSDKVLLINYPYIFLTESGKIFCVIKEFNFFADKIPNLYSIWALYKKNGKPPDEEAVKRLDESVQRNFLLTGP